MSHIMNINDEWNILTLDLNCNPYVKPWKALTPSTPKHTNFEASSSYFNSPCVIKEFMTNKVRQSIAI
jgi:hypothetical protein